MQRLVPLLAFALLAPAPAQAPAPADPAAAFATSLAAIRDTGARGAWKEARDRLRKLLEQHRDAAWAKAAAVELRDLVRQCDVRSQLPPLDPKTLIAGELLQNNLGGGPLKVRYRPAQWQKDCEKANDVWTHPAFFTGAHELELKGKAYPALDDADDKGGAPFALVCADGRNAITVVFGAPGSKGGGRTWHVRPAIRRIEGDSAETLDEKTQTPCVAGKPFTMRVVVGSAQIQLFYNNRPVLTAARPKGAAGQLGFGGWCDYEEITIEGKAERSWLQGLIDKQQHGQLEKLLAQWDARAALPDWLYAASEAAATQATAGAGKRDRTAEFLPDGLSKPQWELLTKVEQFETEGKFAQAVALIEGLAADALPSATRAFTLATLHHALGRLDRAEAAARDACAAAPDHALCRVYHCRLLDELGRTESAAQALAEHLGRQPAQTSVRVQLASMLLALGRRNDAKRVVDEGVAGGFGSKELAQLQTTIRKAERGPDWAKTFTHKTKNFHVTSDIDRQTCEEAGKILEEGYQLYTKTFGPAPESETRLFAVHLFSGETGYKRFCEDLWSEDAPSHTAGLYNKVLKHLLIWNLPSREDMLHTVRHEGFHQYLDRVVRNAPRWFDEGHAEYFETARVVNGVWKLGAVRQDHLDVLAEGRLPLQRLLFVEPEDFYGEASRVHYAQSWLFVHWLRHSGPDAAKRLKTLWEALRSGATPAAAVEAAFGADLAPFDKALADYAISLR